MNDSDHSQDPFAVPKETGGVARPDMAPENLSRDVKKRLGGARWALVIVGVLTIGVNVFLFINATQEIDNLVQGQEELAVDAATAVTVVRVIYGAAIFSGLVFIVLGMLVYRFPIMCPLVGLLMYVGLNGLYGLLDPATLARGAILKIIIIIVLFKAVQSGFEVRRERAQAYDRMFGRNPSA